jgi:hypothetical protein
VVANYGGCRPLLLLAAQSKADFSNWVVSEDDYFFETGERGVSEIPLTGLLLGGPESLAPGPWTVGLGVWNTSDVASEPSWLDVLCTRSFAVDEGTRRVGIRAHFEDPCSIDIGLIPPN